MFAQGSCGKRLLIKNVIITLMKDQYFHKLKAVMHFHKNNKKRESDGVIEKNTCREKTFIRVIESFVNSLWFRQLQPIEAQFGKDKLNFLFRKLNLLLSTLKHIYSSIRLTFKVSALLKNVYSSND
jgi:hypothetical protein